MTRGNLYVVHKPRLTEEQEDYIGSMSERDNIQDDTSDLHAEIEDLLEDLSGRYNADDVIADITSEAESLYDTYDWQDDFVDAINTCGGHAIQFEDYVLFRMTQEAVENWFKSQFQKLKNAVQSLSLADFCNYSKSWELQNAIAGRYEDAFLFESCFYPQDDGIRKLERDTWYAVSNAMLMK